jgi:fatty acid desaturase
MNIDRLAEELEALRLRVNQELTIEDFNHLRKIEWWGRGLSCIGYGTIWLFPNPITAFCISMGHFTRWLLAHHIMHRGYDKIDGVPERYTSKGFARGWRRFIDWGDWLQPEAWDYEHNILHHYHTGEAHDPDVAERHTEYLRSLNIPYWLKYILLFIAACTWKFTYYAPNTVSVLNPENSNRVKKEHIIYLTIKNAFDLSRKEVRTLWMKCYLPYGTLHFVLLPLLFYPFGGLTTVLFVLGNKILAEIFTNIHSFVVIGPNHTADDIYRFDFHYRDKREYYVTQILGSVNYRCGNDFIDYLSIWLNYQIEHHIFPDLPMRQYRLIQPEVKAICARNGVPYRQEPMFRRLRRMVDVCVGKQKMRVITSNEDLHKMAGDGAMA